MMTRSTVGRFLILAVLLVSLGVIAQAALIITKGTGKAVAKGNPAPVAAPVAVAASTPSPQPAASPAPASADPAAPPPLAESAPVRVVYPGPLGDSPMQAHKFGTPAPSMPPAAPSPLAAPLTPAAAPAPAQPVEQASAPVSPAPPSVAAAPPPAPTAPVEVAAADADVQPAPAATDPAPTGKSGVDLNSASVEVLNHLGGGHIGQTIVAHRPYRSVEDLVKKRVVRRSVYDQIKNQLAAR